MAKKSMVAREVKRRRLAELHDKQRIQLKQQTIDVNSSYDERWQAMIDLQKLPRDSSKSRQRNRCARTGRPRGFCRRLGLASCALREGGMRGDAPGVTKASW